jgi:hypothetical protein
MISPEIRVQIRRCFYAEHWKIGTIALQLGLHADTVRQAIEVESFHRAEQLSSSILDPYREFLRQTLDQYPRLRATRLHQMIRDRGYTGSIRQLRRAVAGLRPRRTEAFLRLQTFPADQAQADWAHFGHVMAGRARRPLSCFVITLSWSRALYVEFFFDQMMENFLRGHVHAFEYFSGAPRGGISFTSFGQIETTVTGAELVVTNVFGQNTTFINTAYNGIELSEVGGSPDPIIGVAIDPSTTVAGFDSSRISFDGTDVFLNFEGLPFGTTDQMDVDLTFADSSSSSTPEPATILLASAGLAAAAFGLRLRSEKSAA